MEIDLLHTKGIKNNFITSYFQSYIKYKIESIRKPKYTGSNIEKFLALRNSFKIFREKYFLRVRSRTYKPMRIGEFVNNSREVWELNYVKTIELIVKQVDNLSPLTDVLANGLFYLLTDMKTSKLYTFKSLNLMRSMIYLKSPFEVSSVNEIKGDAFVNLPAMSNCLREFYIKFKEQKLGYNPNDSESSCRTYILPRIDKYGEEQEDEEDEDGEYYEDDDDEDNNTDEELIEDSVSERSDY